MTRPIRIGIQLPEIERLVRWPELRTIATTAEAAGFDSIWVGDHLLYRIDGTPRGPWEAWSVLAALAAVTEDVLLGPLVAATAFHNPAMLAKKAATVDEISGGRLILGLGAGWNETEFTAYGFPYEHRASRFAEAFTIIRTLLREGSIDYAGAYYTVRDCELVPRPRPGGPQLMVGSIGPRLLAETLPHVDMWNAWHAWYGNTPQGLTDLIARIDEQCRAVGRDPAAVAKTAAVQVRAPGGTGRIYGDSEHSGERYIEGDRDDVAAALAAFAGTGVAHIQLVVDPITAASVEWLGGVLTAMDGL
jgi:alkanesulfonate monooxygenase SsuD/methylene tetrahydromethanopterin reductase-like flavin-dependent oxidoreductase (luciferase family)